MIYLDYNASTPLDPQVRGLLTELEETMFGNPSSIQHPVGRIARDAVETARAQVASLVGATSQSVIFTSGATEALSLAILGTALGDRQGRHRILVAAAEHKAALAAVDKAAALAPVLVERVPALSDGSINPEALRQSMGDDVLLVVAMLANNETGALTDVHEVSRLVRQHGSLFLCDSTQAPGKIDTRDLASLADLVTISAHKMYGPKGVGALVASRDAQARMSGLVTGGGHERGLRGGTINAPAVAAMGLAADLAVRDIEAGLPRQLADLSHFFLSRVQELLPSVLLNSDRQGLPNTLSLRFPGLDAEAIMANAPDLCVSTGSACQSAVVEPSHVLIAAGLSPQAASECLRVSIGKFTTSEELIVAAEHLSRATERLELLTSGGVS